MNKPTKNSVPTTELAAPQARVRLKPVTCNYSKPYPPDGYKRLWWERLKTALGTTSSDFVNATLVQIQNASRMPSGGISEMSVNAVLAFIESAKPKNEVQAALAIQMACTHAVTMVLLTRLGGGFSNSRNAAMIAGAAAKLMKAFTAQVDSLRRLNHGSSQLVRVEHVHINEGGQAVIGNVVRQGPDADR